jgi:UDP-N-acetylglucosamine--N-acetylmuramyl-(pentapeptide) pyrophosphoryl-undecaprenol N-acetylglucosamine transferase
VIPATPGFSAVVTGGGTSGHVLPALAIADALVEHGCDRSAIHYVGTQRGIETTLVPPTGYPATYLDVIGLQRSITLRNLAVAPKLVRSVRAATTLLRELHPQVVVNVGGYASFPASWAATRLSIPLVVVSYDRRPGLVTRLLAVRATAVAAAFEDSTLPGAQWTGAPIRREFVHLDRARARDSARAALGVPGDRFLVGVVCGSLGASAVNEAVAELVQRWSDRADLAVHHVVGERFLTRSAPARDDPSGILYRVIGYEDRMAQLYAAADLMVTRAGAGTLAELTATGTPAIVVPWPDAAENHQLENARALADLGAVELLEQDHLDRLGDLVESYVGDRSRLDARAGRSFVAGAHHRSTALVDLIAEVAHGGGR